MANAPFPHNPVFPRDPNIPQVEYDAASHTYRLPPEQYRLLPSHVGPVSRMSNGKPDGFAGVEDLFNQLADIGELDSLHTCYDEMGWSATFRVSPVNRRTGREVVSEVKLTGFTSLAELLAEVIFLTHMSLSRRKE